MSSSPAEPRRRKWSNWWVVVAGLLVVFQVACWAIPQSRPGLVGVITWLLGFDLVPRLALLMLPIGLIVSAIWRPFWSPLRGMGFLLLIFALIIAPQLLFRVYPSSHDGKPSKIPFRLPLDGPITVAWGGGTPRRNYHVIAPDQRWAYDLVVTKDAKSHEGEGKALTDYFIYDRPVLAPCDATVRRVTSGETDLTPGQMSGFEHPGGNHVVLDVGPGEFVFLCHLKPGSIRVKEGDTVSAGQEIARVGNTGNTSEPHLHIHLQDTPEFFLGEGIPMPFHHYREGKRLIARGIPTGGMKENAIVGQVVEHAPAAAKAAPAPPPPTNSSPGPEPAPPNG